MKLWIPRSLMIAGMLAAPVAVSQPEFPSAPSYEDDPRLETLREFFSAMDSPGQDLSEDFLWAADQHDLDWRLLPSISVIESGGGLDARNNNLFGWNNGKTFFPSVRAGIHNVASRLANSKLYRNKDLDELLRTYNPSANYPHAVKSVMRRISRTEKL
jgi:hypothetical protein